MALKFFNIGKANAEIARLESELNKVNELLKAQGENESEVMKEAESLSAQLTAEKGKTTALSAENERLKTELKSSQDKQSDFDSKVQTAASAKALEITAGQTTGPVSSGGGQPMAGDLLAEHAALMAKDPSAATAFYRKNKAAYDAAFEAKNREKK